MLVIQTSTVIRMGLSNGVEKRHHDLRLVRLLFEHSPEREFAVQPGITQNRGNLVLQTHRFSRNITEPAPHRVDPVSYTHLDVYKRQIWSKRL